MGAASIAVDITAFIAEPLYDRDVRYRYFQKCFNCDGTYLAYEDGTRAELPPDEHIKLCHGHESVPVDATAPVPRTRARSHDSPAARS
jgi:hypothetical protein